MWCQRILTPLLDTFPVWVHTYSCCVDADSPTHSCRHSELCFGWLFNEDQFQSIITVVVQLTHTKNNINSIHFNNNIKINHNVKWHRRNSWPFPIHISWTLLSEACIPSLVVILHIGCCGHSCNSEHPSLVVLFSGISHGSGQHRIDALLSCFRWLSTGWNIGVAIP